MNFIYELEKLQREKDSLLCVRIDPDIEKIPDVFNGPGAFLKWCKAIVDQTISFTAVYKPNTSLNTEELTELILYIQKKGALVILDDIEGVFTKFNVDAVELKPGMDLVQIMSYLKETNKGFTIPLLGADVDSYSAEQVSNLAKTYSGRICLSVSASVSSTELSNIRAIIGDIPILIPDIEEQNGDVETIITTGQTHDGSGMIIHTSSNNPNPYCFIQGAREGTNMYRNSSEQVSWKWISCILIIYMKCLFQI